MHGYGGGVALLLLLLVIVMLMVAVVVVVVAVVVVVVVLRGLVLQGTFMHKGVRGQLVVLSLESSFSIPSNKAFHRRKRNYF